MILDKLSKLEGREKAGLMISALFAFACLVNWTVIHPFVIYTKDLDREIDSVKTTLKLYGKRLADKEPIEAEFDKINRLIEKPLPEAAAIRKIKGEFDVLLTEAGIASYQSLDAMEPSKNEFYEVYSVKIEGFQTDMPHLLQLLDRIQGMRMSPGMTKVTQLTVSHNPSSKYPRKGTLVISKVVAATTVEEVQK